MKKTFKSAYCNLTITKKFFSRELLWEAVWEDNEYNIEIWKGVIPSPSKSLLKIIKKNNAFNSVWHFFNPRLNKNSVRII